MYEPRLLDAAHLEAILLWVARNHGFVLGCSSEEINYNVQILDSNASGIAGKIDRNAIKSLAEHLRVVTAIDVSGNSEALTRILAQIALMVNVAGPKVGHVETESTEISPTVYALCSKFAVACAVSFAEHHGYQLDTGKIPYDETSFALLMNDDELLSKIFSNAIHGPHNPRTSPSSDDSLNGIISAFENSLAAIDPIPRSRVKTERKLPAPTYFHLRRTAHREQRQPREFLTQLDDYFNSMPELESHAADNASTEIPTYFARFSVKKTRPATSSSDIDRSLPATNYWNLRSIARAAGWTSNVQITLIEEHLYPALSRQLVQHNNSIAGGDWLRLYSWIYEQNREVLCLLRIPSKLI